MKKQLSEIKALFEEAISKYNAGECLIENKTPFSKLSFSLIQEDRYGDEACLTITCQNFNISEKFWLMAGTYECDHYNASFLKTFIFRQIKYLNLSSILLNEITIKELIGMFGWFCEFKTKEPKKYRAEHKNFAHETNDEKISLYFLLSLIRFKQDGKIPLNGNDYHHLDLLNGNRISAKNFDLS